MQNMTEFEINEFTVENLMVIAFWPFRYVGGRSVHEMASQRAEIRPARPWRFCSWQVCAAGVEVAGAPWLIVGRYILYFPAFARGELLGKWGEPRASVRGPLLIRTASLREDDVHFT